METRFTSFLDIISRWCLYVIVFATPLYFLPVLSNSVELHKYFLFYGLVLLALLAYLGRAVVLKSFKLRRTPLDGFLLAVWLIFLVSSIFSQNRFLSFFGDFSFLKLSFVGFSLLLVFYFLLIQHINSGRRVLTMIYLLLVSGGLVVLHFILQVGGLFNFAELSLPTISLVHPSNVILGVFVTLIMLLALSLLGIRARSLLMDGFALVIFLLSLAALIMLGFKLIWVLAVIGIFLLLVFFLTYYDLVRTIWSSLAFLVLIVSLLFVVLGIPEFLKAEVPAELSLSQGTSWGITLDTVTNGVKNFMLGTGPGTFVYNFSTFRPEVMNANFAWNVRFNQPASTALEWLATAGVLAGLALVGTFLIVLGLILATWLKHVGTLRKNKRSEQAEIKSYVNFYDSPLLFWGLAACWLYLLVGIFVVNFGIVHWMLFWLLLALMVSLSAKVTKQPLRETTISLKTTPQYVLITSFSFILIFTAIIVLGTYLGRFYAAEFVYARSLNQDTEQRILGVQNAIKLNPYRPQFHLTLSDTYLARAQRVANEGGDINDIYVFLSEAVGAARTATDVAPKNVATWEFLSNMYANARSVAPDANKWVLDSLDRAIELEPTNPLLYLSRGNAKSLEGNYEEARDDLEKATSLKPDLINGYMNWAVAYELEGDFDGALSVLDKGLVYGRNNPAYLMQMGRYFFNRNSEGDFANAEIVLRQAVNLSPNYSDALFALGVLYEATDNKNVALPLFEKVLELNPGNDIVEAKIEGLKPPPSDEEE